jgi:polyhydroxybutyrate depolymerase
VGTTTSTTTTTVLQTTTTAVAATTTQAPSAGQGCEVLHQPGEYKGLGQFGDLDQPYWMVVPASYAEIAPAPLYLHLASGGGDHNPWMDGWRPYLDDLDGVMAMVNTVTAARGKPDALASLIDHIGAEYCVDPQRVHVMGGSSSFPVADRLACEHSDKVASFSAIAGSSSATDCAPTRPVPLLAVTGDPDRGGVGRLVERWVTINGCDPEPVVEDLGSGVQQKAYQNCAADILFYDIEGMGHTFPMHEPRGPAAALAEEYEELDFLEAALQFFAEHPLP